MNDAYSRMKPIEIADQPRLSLARTVLITVTGIRYRLFRALVTVAVIAVAIAFLMNILSESLIKRAVQRHTSERIERMHLVHDWASQLLRPGTREQILARLASPDQAKARVSEMARMGGLGELSDLQGAARRAIAYLAFFENLDYARRRTLVHTSSGTDVFDRLGGDGMLDEFAHRLADMRSVRLPGTVEELSEFLAEWPATRNRVDGILAGYERAVRQASAALDGRTVIGALAEADAGFGDAIRGAGFEFDETDVQPAVQQQAGKIVAARSIERTIEHEAARQAIAQWHNVLPGDVTMKLLWETLQTQRAAKYYLRKLDEAGLAPAMAPSDAVSSAGGSVREAPAGLTPERIVELAAVRQEELALARAERQTVGMGTGWMGLGRRMFWLVLVSMLVCVIGISNAMLMAVTERFREIATMKCLGAMDGFIMLMFVLESCLMGIVGGCIGGAVGTLLGLGRMATAFGTRYALAVPVADLLAAVCAATLIGVALAAVAAVYPAFRAARLAPMEAMRIE